MDGIALFVAASAASVAVALDQRRSNQRIWTQTCRQKQRVTAEEDADATRAADKQARERKENARHVKATRERHQERRSRRIFVRVSWLDLYEWLATDLRAEFELDYVRGVAGDLIFELDANHLDFLDKELADVAVADKQTRPTWLYWQFAFLVCRNTNSLRTEGDVLAGLLAAMRNYPGDHILAARVVHVLAVTWQLVSDMKLTYVMKMQRCVAGSWQVDASEPHWSAVAWKKAVYLRIKNEWMAFVIDFVGKGQEGGVHGNNLLVAIELEEFDSDCEGEIVDGVYLHFKKKPKC